MIYQSFIDAFYKDNKEITNDRVVRVAKKIDNIFVQLKGANKTPAKNTWNEMFSSKDLIELIFHPTMSKSYDLNTFNRTKSIVLKFITHLYNNNLLDEKDAKIAFVNSIKYEDIMHLYNSSNVLYKDLKSVIDELDKIGAYHFSILKESNPKVADYIPNEQLLHIKAIVILSWYGFIAKEMIEIEKSNVVHIRDEYYIKHNKTKVTISQFAYNILQLYIKAKSHRTVPGYRLINYKDSSKLIRLKSKKVTVPTLNNFVKVFNEYISTTPFDIRISFTTLKQCNIFNKIYQKVSTSKVTPFQAAKLYNPDDDNSSIFYLVNKYKLWKNLFYPDNH